jgi:hypothetical protein
MVVPSSLLRSFPFQKVCYWLPSHHVLNQIDAASSANKKHRKTALFHKFCRQLYHACLARIFAPLKAGMTTPDVIRCPDGYFRRAIYGIGPYIADYPEQVWLAAVVNNWCPKYVFIGFTVPVAATNFQTIDATHSQITLMPKALRSGRIKQPNAWSQTLTLAFYGMILEYVATLW